MTDGSARSHTRSKSRISESCTASTTEVEMSRAFRRGQRRGKCTRTSSATKVILFKLYNDGMTIADAAEIAGVNPNTAKLL